jgi:hypothetical protein
MLKRFLILAVLALLAAPCGAADWAKPVSTDTYLNVLTYLREKDTDLATLFSAGAPANLATGAIRLNRSTSPWQFEQWTGSAWSAISVKAALSDTATSATSATSATNATQLAGQPGSYYTNYVLARLGAGTTSGVTDWNNAANTIPGTGPTLLMGSATNGPGPASYFHAFNFEYATKDGSGQITQFAIPYSQSTSLTSGPYMRGRYSGVWSAWYKLWHEGNDGPSSGLAAQTAATATTATTATSAGKWTTARTLTLTGNVTGSASMDGSANASLAATVVKLGTARTIALSGDVTGSASFDGSANATIVATVDPAGHSHTADYITGAIPITGNPTVIETSSTSYVKKLEYYVPGAGTVVAHVSVSPYCIGQDESYVCGGGSAAIYKNGVKISGDYTSGTSSMNVTVALGDLVQLYVRKTSNPGVQASLGLKAAAPTIPAFQVW